MQPLRHECWFSLEDDVVWSIPCMAGAFEALHWLHNERDGVSDHQPHDCLLNRLFRHRSKKTSKLHETGLCEGNSPVTGEFPAQRASNAENVAIWWRHHGLCILWNSYDNMTSHYFLEVIRLTPWLILLYICWLLVFQCRISPEYCQ